MIEKILISSIWLILSFLCVLFFKILPTFRDIKGIYRLPGRLTASAALIGSWVLMGFFKPPAQELSGPGESSNFLQVVWMILLIVTGVAGLITLYRLLFRKNRTETGREKINFFSDRVTYK